MAVEFSDAELVERVRAGEREAFAGLVERHGGRVRSMLLRLVHDPDQADDLAQDTFLRAFRGIEGFRGQARFGTWVVQIALHLARDRGRQRQRRGNVVSLDELRERREEGADPPAHGAWSDPSDAVSDHELADRLADALAQLPPKYREVFVLRHQQDLDYEEISRITGDTVGSLKVRAHRARQLLKEMVFEEDDGPGQRRSTYAPGAPEAAGREGDTPSADGPTDAPPTHGPAPGRQEER